MVYCPWKETLFWTCSMMRTAKNAFRLSGYMCIHPIYCGSLTWTLLWLTPLLSSLSYGTPPALLLFSKCHSGCRSRGRFLCMGPITSNWWCSEGGQGAGWAEGAHSCSRECFSVSVAAFHCLDKWSCCGRSCRSWRYSLMLGPCCVFSCCIHGPSLVVLLQLWVGMQFVRVEPL